MRRRYLRNRARGNIVYPGLIAAWSAKGKTNDDEDRAILKDLTGNGHDITLNGFAFNTEGSGYNNPLYPDALVFDGVDDYGSEISFKSNVKTIITKFQFLSTNIGFLYYWRGSNGLFRVAHNNKVDEKSEIRYIYTSNGNYKVDNNCIVVSSGEIESILQVPFQLVGYKKNNELLKFVFYSAYLFDRSLDEQEIKSFIRKYIDPEYLLPSEIPNPDCYYDFSLGSNDDENRETIVDQSGNGNNAVAHNFAWSGMSGYGRYNIDFTEWDASRTDNVKTKTSITITRVNDAGYKTFQIMNTTDSVMIIPSFKVRIKGLSSYTDIKLRYYFGGEEPFELQKDGDYILPEATITNKYSTAGFQILSVNGSNDHIGKDINITIELLPEYEGALVLDGVDDYISLDAFDSGFKTVFMVCTNLNTNIKYMYDQRENGQGNNFALFLNQSSIAYNGLNTNGTYINNVLNNKVKVSDLINKKHLINVVTSSIGTVIPIIGSNVNKGSFSNIAIYKFLGFKEELTEEQIKAIIKKYNLLDGVDKIEVS